MHYTELYNISYYVAKDHSIIITAALVHVVENTLQGNAWLHNFIKKLVYISHNETAASIH